MENLFSNRTQSDQGFNPYIKINVKKGEKRRRRRRRKGMALPLLNTKDKWPDKTSDFQ